MWVIEFQQRGLPHAHILVMLKASDAPKTADDYDKFVCAELPNKNVDRILHELVLKFHVHGPCGKRNPKAKCMGAENVDVVILNHSRRNQQFQKMECRLTDDEVQLMEARQPSFEEGSKMNFLLLTNGLQSIIQRCY